MAIEQKPGGANGRVEPFVGPEHDPIVGHKTFSDGPLMFRHEPLRKSEADAILAAVDAADKRRAELMPDEESARRMLWDAQKRLKEFGWRDAIYCPKDGSAFDVIELDSSGVHQCRYQGEWPDGTWWIDDYTSRPALYRRLTPNAPAQPPAGKRDAP